MFHTIISFILRVGLIVAFWASVWGFIKPTTQFMRIVRAVLLVLGLLGILAVVRGTG